MTTRSRSRLTERAIRQLKPASSDTWLWDGAFPGFGVRCKPSGAKSYVLWYRTQPHNEKRLLTLGNVAAKNLEQARVDARASLASVDKGHDPVVERRTARRGQTVKDLLDRYMKEHAKPHKRASSTASDQRLIERVIVPAIGQRKVAAITGADIAALHADLSATPFQANRTLAVLSKAFSLASLWGMRSAGSNPCKGIQRFKEPRRDRRILPAEMTALGAALVKVEREGTEQPGCILAIRLLAMTGCRASEICNARWVDIDLGARLLRLPDSKTGARVVSIGGAAVGLLSGVKRDSDYVCHGPGTREPLSLWTLESAWRRIRDEAKLPDLRLHDLRHAAATAAADAGYSAFQVKALLGHATLAMAARYVARAEDPARAAADHVAAVTAAALAGHPARPKQQNRRG